MKTNLQALRKEAGFRSARVFAEAMEVKVSTYTSYEQGRYDPPLEQAWAFADALGDALGRHVSLDELAGREFPVATSPPLDARCRALVTSYEACDQSGREAIEAAVQGIAARFDKRGNENLAGTLGA